MSDDFDGLNDARREARKEYGKKCFGCISKYPKRNPTVLFVYQICKMCGYKRPPAYEEQTHDQNYYVMPFGKYKKQFFKDIDIQYLDWLYNDMKDKIDKKEAKPNFLFNNLQKFLT